MTIIEQKMSLDEALQHFGVKGMQWGVRREQRRGRNQQIKDARRRITTQTREINVIDRQARKAKTASERAKLDALSTKKASALFNSPDHTTANRMTTGEKFVMGLLLTGAVGVGAAVRAL